MLISFISVGQSSNFSKGYLVTAVFINEPESLYSCSNKVSYLFIDDDSHFLDSLYLDQGNGFYPIFFEGNNFKLVDSIYFKDNSYLVPRVLNSNSAFGLNVDSLLLIYPSLYKKWSSLESILSGTTLIKKSYEKGVYVHIEKVREMTGFEINKKEFYTFERTQYDIYAHDGASRISLRGIQKFCLKDPKLAITKVIIPLDYNLCGDRYREIFPEYESILWK